MEDSTLGKIITTTAGRCKMSFFLFMIDYVDDLFLYGFKIPWMHPKLFFT